MNDSLYPAVIIACTLHKYAHSYRYSTRFCDLSVSSSTYRGEIDLMYRQVQYQFDKHRL